MLGDDDAWKVLVMIVYLIFDIFVNGISESKRVRKPLRVVGRRRLKYA